MSLRLRKECWSDTVTTSIKAHMIAVRQEHMTSDYHPGGPHGECVARESCDNWAILTLRWVGVGVCDVSPADFYGYPWMSCETPPLSELCPTACYASSSRFD